MKSVGKTFTYDDVGHQDCESSNQLDYQVAAGLHLSFINVFYSKSFLKESSFSLFANSNKN